MDLLISSNEVSEDDLVHGIVLHGLDVIEHTLVENQVRQQFVERCVSEFLNYPFPKQDAAVEWYMPDSYKEMDIIRWCIDQCATPDEVERTQAELELFRAHNMINVLRCMKYIVDVFRQNNVIWGVGRGSSVSSFVLYLIGVHRINSIRYNLSIDEFFKEV